ncbi:MAG: tRNA (adenosine(37)-N6)-threonylcarbamoyltransferase complex ATPase subunit type 1 TsaE [Gammaproteobacteria bacterium]|nr:tRNA (adenosine(37)-N6)-threonylcarbamoyltransferase complex ATPase subunit type 1 TsaE [Gammaproteobacteria bacterium]
MSIESLHFEPGDETEQQLLGARMASVFAAGVIIFLQGELGAGKTTLVRGFLRGLGYRGNVKSPTYTLIEPYLIDHHTICHLDLYRLADADELEYLGVRDLLAEQATLLIEWPERGEGALPSPDLRIDIRYLEQGRSLTVSAESSVGAHQLTHLKALLQSGKAGSADI